MIYNIDKIIEEEVSGVGVHAKYVKPDGTPWATDPHPFWLWLGTWTTSRGNKSIGAINLNKVVTRHGDEGLQKLKTWLPKILQNIPTDNDINLENIDHNFLDTGHILFEAAEARPLKSTGTAIGRWEYGAKYADDETINDIFNNCYETPLINRMSEISKEIIESIPKTVPEALEKGTEAIEEIEERVKQFGPPPSEGPQYATTDEPMGAEPEELVEPEDITAPPEEPPVEPEEPELPETPETPEEQTEGIPLPTEVPPKAELKPPEEDPIAKAAAQALVNTNQNRTENNQEPIAGITKVGKKGKPEIVVKPGSTPEKVDEPLETEIDFDEEGTKEEI